MNEKVKNFIGGILIVGALGLPLAAKPLPLTADEPTQNQLTTEERIAQAKVRLSQFVREYCTSANCQEVENHVNMTIYSFVDLYHYYHSRYNYSIEECEELAKHFYKVDFTPLHQETEISN